MRLKNYFQLLAIISLSAFLPGKSFAQIVINEYSCSNRTGFTDNFGNNPDWLELYNAGGAAVSLSGYHLSDKASNPTKYTFPAGISIPANGFLKVWCSGQNTVVGTNIHSSIKFTQTKPEVIIFADPGGAILDSMTTNPTQLEHSRARMTDGGATWGIATTPTPGSSNTGVLQNYATRPTMSIAAGFYAAGQTVSISSPDAGVTIHYTTDGSVPTAASTTYAAPVSVSATTVLRARAFSSNPAIPPSFVESNTYFIGTNHTLPVISIFGDQTDNLLGGSSIVAETGLEFFDKTKVQRAETEGEANEHGNDSWSYPQRGIDFISRDEFGYNYAINYKVFGNKSRKSFQRIILKAAANDNYPSETGGAHIRDAYAHTISQLGKLDLDERTCTFAVMYLNGQYWGVYDVREKVDDNDFTDYYYKQDEPNLQYLQTWGSTWSAYGGAQAQTDWNTIRSYITSNNMAIQSNYDHVDSIFNVKSFVDYFVLNSWLVTSDWLNWNTAWWRGLDPAGDKKKWRYTLWDLDAIMGHYINYTGIPVQNTNADPCNVEGLPNPGGQGHTEILSALMANPGFKQYYQARYVDLMNTALNCSTVLPIYDSMITLITPEMAQHCAKWGGTFAQWQANAAAFRTDISNRCTAMTQGMINCYALTGPYNITVDVQPVGAGDAKVNSITPPSYIFNASYFGGMNTILRAKANAGYVFDHWEMSHHTPSPSSSSDSVTVDFNQSDDIIAVFRLPSEPPGGMEVGVPTAFSPNGDGNNDVLYVLGSVEKLDFAIYNRWGQQVFHTSDRSLGWDGKFNGQQLNPGVFAYRLSGILPNGDPVERKGNITLVR